MVKRKFTDEELRILHAEGLNDVEIAKKLGVHRSTVSGRRRRLGLEPNDRRGRKRKWTRERVLKELRELYRELGRPPLQEDNPSLFQSIYEYGFFDSFDDARRAAGVPTLDGEHSRSPRTSRKTIEYLYRLLSEVATDLDVEESVESDAREILKRWVEEEGTFRGWSLNSILAGALYAACRRDGRVVTPGEIAASVNEHGKQNVKKVRKGDVRRITRKIVRKIGERAPEPYSLEAFVEKYGGELSLPEDDREELIGLAREFAERANIAGRSKRGLAAAMIYAFAKSTRTEHEERLTQEEVAQACGTTQGTIRNSLEWITDQVSESNELSRLYSVLQGARASKTDAVLEALREKPMSFSELKSNLDVSKVWLSEVLSELVDADEIAATWVLREERKRGQSRYKRVYRASSGPPHGKMTAKEKRSPQKYEGMLYVIKARVKARGVVEVQDVVGAIYNETRGLLPRAETLNDLQDVGLVGGINVNANSEEGVTSGAVFVSTRLPPRETSELAAALEIIEKIGPCEAEVEVEEIKPTKKARMMIRSGELHQELLERIREVEAS